MKNKNAQKLAALSVKSRREMHGEGFDDVMRALAQRPRKKRKLDKSKRSSRIVAKSG